MVSRFIGATPASSDGRSLLESVCRQVTRIYAGDEATIPSDYRELVKEFGERLKLPTAEKPLILFLDALDQLSDADHARNLIWLPAELPEYVRLLVSTLTGECKTALERKLPAANLVMSVVSSTMNELKTDDVSRISDCVPPKQSARLVTLIEDGKISFSIAKDVWLKAFNTRKPVDLIIDTEGLLQIDDESQILALVDDVVRKNADAVAKYRGGNAGTFGFLVGQVMKSAGGKANPKRVNELLKRALDA